MRRARLTLATCAGVAGALALGVFGDVASAATPYARQIYAPLFLEDVVQSGPCLLTVALPASEKENCIEWTQREASGAAFHPPSGLLLLGGSDKKLRALSAKNGRKRYAVDLPGALVSKPVLDGNSALFGTNESHVLRVDITSGRIRWDVEVDAEVIEPMVVYGGTAYAVTGLDTLYAFDAITGESKWNLKHRLPPGITLRGQARPLVVRVRTPTGFESRVFQGHADGRMSIIDADTGRVLNQLELGRKEAFNDLDADAIFVAGQVVTASQSTGVFALDPRNGAILWRNEETGIGRLSAAGDKLVIAAGAGKVIAYDARNGSARWRFKFEKGAPTRVVVKGSRVHVASDRGPLYVLDLFSGRPLQYYGSGLGFAADLELVGDMLFAVSTAGTLHALSNAFDGKVQRGSRR